MKILKTYQLTANRFEMTLLGTATLFFVASAIHHRALLLFAISLYQAVGFICVLFFHLDDKQSSFRQSGNNKKPLQKIDILLLIICLVLVLSGALIRASVDWAANNWCDITPELIVATLISGVCILLAAYSAYRFRSLAFFHFDWILGVSYIVLASLCNITELPYIDMFLTMCILALLNYKLWQLLIFQVGISGLGFLDSIKMDEVVSILQNTDGVQSVVTFKIHKISLNKNRLWARLYMKREITELEMIRVKSKILSKLKKYQIYQIIIETVQHN